MSKGLQPYVCSACARHLRRSKLTSLFAAQQRRYSVRPVIQDGRPFRMAVIGSGPAGFYTAYRVMAKIENAVIDMYEHLPVPFGLVRFGVAPDHPEVKNCEDKFREVAESPNFNFVGNISIGTNTGSLPLSSIAPHYDAILFAYGASKDRMLGIDGEDTLTGIYSARAFVGWYNGLPEYANLNPDLSRGEEAVIIGQGNVALDVARILLKDLDTLRKTDITEYAVETLSKSTVKQVRVVGRRGAMQAAFTIKEARELMNLPSVAFNPIDKSMFPPDSSQLPRASKRLMQLLTKGSGVSKSVPLRTWSLDFLLSPVALNAKSNTSDSLGSITFEQTYLEPDLFSPGAKAKGSNLNIDLPATTAFRSIGYKSEPIDGLLDLGIPFDQRLGIIPNDEYGRVLGPSQGPLANPIARHVPGMYCAGWVKRGPTGVIATTMNDAFSTADAIAQDWHSHAQFNASDTGETQHFGWEAVKTEAEKRGCRRVTWHDWVKIDKAEVESGRLRGKEREKYTRISDMLAVLD